MSFHNKTLASHDRASFGAANHASYAVIDEHSSVNADAAGLTDLPLPDEA